MYEYICGKLTEKTPSFTVVDVHGIGYKLSIPINHFGKLPAEGGTLLLYTAWVVRENSQTLYGFLTRKERDLFEMLITISGVGPKTALSLIGHLELAGLEKAVKTNNALTMSKVPGIGKKTAERLIVDLKNKLNLEITTEVPSQVQDAMRALMNLGYSQESAKKAVHKAAAALPQETDLSKLISEALKS